MSKMYHQYEQQRMDDVVDPRERQQRPISTISGINDEEKPVPKSTVKISEISEGEAEALQKAGTELFLICVFFCVLRLIGIVVLLGKSLIVVIFDLHKNVSPCNDQCLAGQLGDCTAWQKL